MGLLGFVGICLAVGIAGSGIAGGSARAWYLSLAAPPATPPDWVFGPVWAAVYVGIGVAAWMVWRRQAGPWRGSAISAWGWQLLIGALWAPLFFGLHLLLAALGVSLVLLGATGITISRFRRLSGPAALLMLPYLGWAAFAGYLSAGFWWLNH